METPTRKIISAALPAILVLSNLNAAPDTKKNDISTTAKELAADKSTKLIIYNKTHDPFGLNQDPNAKPAKPSNTPSKPQKPKARKIALAKEILKLKEKINGIGPNQMMVGPTIYKRGHPLTLMIGPAKKPFKLKIMKITPTEIIFRNLGDGGIITLDMQRDEIFDTNSGPNAIPTSDDGMIIIK